MKLIFCICQSALSWQYETLNCRIRPHIGSGQNKCSGMHCHKGISAFYQMSVDIYLQTAFRDVAVECESNVVLYFIDNIKKCLLIIH